MSQSVSRFRGITLNRSQRTIALLFALFALLLVAPGHPAHANGDEEGEWGQIATQISTHLDQAKTAYDQGDVATAQDHVKTARYELFSGSGLEEQIATHLSGSDAGSLKMDFGELSSVIRSGDTERVTVLTERLGQQLEDLAKSLDGESVSFSDLKVSPGKWGQTATAMVDLLDRALTTYQSGDAGTAKDLVNEAYYGHYEISGFEKMTMARVSGGRVAHIELEFALIKKAMNEGNDAVVTEKITALKPLLVQDANALDGFDPSGDGELKGTAASTIFLATFMVIIREGMEAILVVAAVIAYLVKAGHQDKTKVVWYGAGAALGVSIILAVLLTKLTGLAGKNQELIEGFTALAAVAMLIYVSNWMLGKSDAAAWDRFIKDKTDTSLSRGSLLSLAFVAFLAVVREGAETILFFQPILSMAEGQTSMVWIGLLVGAVCLLAVYLAIRFLSVRIPLRPFFIVTSALLAIMALTFTGSGIRELQEADLVSVTPVPGLPLIDFLGFYPRVENLAAQAIVLVLMIGLFFFGYRRNNRAKADQ